MLTEDESTSSSDEAPGATVLFDDNFQGGLCGWVGLRSGDTSRGAAFSPWPSLSPEARSGAPYSLVLWPGKGVNKTCYALKRVGVNDGLLSWSALYGWNATRPDYLRFIRWAIDYQRGQDRYWLEVRYRHFDEGTGRISPAWSVETGSLEAPSLLEIPETSYELGYNMYRKVNFHHIEVVFDTRTGKYHSLTVDDRRFDLSNLPGVRSSRPEVPFANGLNFILIAQTRSNEPESDPYVLMDRPRGEVRL